jgi:predicted glycogen debranching enzyme
LRLKQFRRDPFPVFVYDLDGAELEKTVFMVHGENTTVIEYEWKGKGKCVLEVRPLLAFRDYHNTTHENGAINSTLELEPGRVTVLPYQGCPDLSLAHTATDVEAEGHWYRNFEYTIEQERGLDNREDLFNPMMLKFVMSGGSRASVIASTQKRNAAEAGSLRVAELERRNSIGAARDPFERALFMAADQFIVRRGEGSTVVAGYHWFSDWGRDTMIALPGLTLATGCYDDARGMLLAFAGSVDHGMLPNASPMRVRRRNTTPSMRHFGFSKPCGHS